MQRPLTHYEGNIRLTVQRVIRRHATNRGLFMPDESKGRRRPRTVFMSTETDEQLELADIVWLTDPETRKLSVHTPESALAELSTHAKSLRSEFGRQETP